MLYSDSKILEGYPAPSYVIKRISQKTMLCVSKPQPREKKKRKTIENDFGF